MWSSLRLWFSASLRHVRFDLNRDESGSSSNRDLILRAPERARLEGWLHARSCLLPSFETPASRAPQDEVVDFFTGPCASHDMTGRADGYNPNTNIIVWWRISRSSGVRTCRVFDTRLSPARMTTYCLPPVSKVMGGAEKPVPTLIFHNCSSDVSS